MQVYEMSLMRHNGLSDSIARGRWRAYQARRAERFDEGDRSPFAAWWAYIHMPAAA